LRSEIYRHKDSTILTGHTVISRHTSR